MHLSSLSVLSQFSLKTVHFRLLPPRYRAISSFMKNASHMYFYIFIAAGRLFDEIDFIYTLNKILKLQAVQKYFKIIKKYIL